MGLIEKYIHEYVCMTKFFFRKSDKNLAKLQLGLTTSEHTGYKKDPCAKVKCKKYGEICKVYMIHKEIVGGGRECFGDEALICTG